jgi:CubicO group peptidase (beta-lactamase class C family)
MTTTEIQIQGRCDDRFVAVRDAFAQNFATEPEVGAAVAVSVGGELVVDLWAGHADAKRTRPWERDTIVNLFSTTKGMVALAAHMLADRGQLDFEAPVARYWPEFAQAGKENVPVRYLLTHQVGLNVLEGDLTPEQSRDWDTVVTQLASQTPRWEPGTKQGYHTGTFGHLVGEVIRRVSGKSVGTFVREEIAGPLGVEFLIGFGPHEDARVADVLSDTRTRPAEGIATMIAAIDWNARELRAAELPSGNGHGNARALATIYGVLACGGESRGVRLLSREAVDRARVQHANGRDETLGVPTHRTLGFMLPFVEFGDARPVGTFGHAGAGGSQGFADPERTLGFGYAMNQMLNPQPGETRPPTGGMDPRGQRLVQAVYASL